MSRSRYLSLEEARNAGQIDRFAAEHPSTADREVFGRLLGAMASGKPPAEAGTSGAARSEDCSETRSRPDTSGDAS